jgi:hypothetical protein
MLSSADLLGLGNKIVTDKKTHDRINTNFLSYPKLHFQILGSKYV